MRPFLIIIVFLNAGLLFGQNFAYPTIKQNGVLIRAFIPAGWTILDSTIGDLNNDKLLDAIVILQDVDTISLIKIENEIEDTLVTRPRILIILFKTKSDNSFHLVEQSNTYILTYDDPFADDPYQSTTITKGILQINFHWYPNSGNDFKSSIYKFRYQAGDFVLIGAEFEESNKVTHDFTNYSYDFLTKKRILSKGNWDKKIDNKSTISLNFKDLKTIGTLKQPYTWEVENGINL